MSSRFERGLARVLAWEDVYSNDPNDPGGETCWGISRRYHPDWPGWQIVDEIKRAARDRGVLRQALRGSSRLDRMVEAFYAAEFWSPLRAGELERRIGEKLFEMAVNVDSRTAIELLQATLCALDVELDIDGKIGPKTIAAANTYHSPATLYDALQGAHAGFYIGRRNPRYKRGWLNRALDDRDEPIDNLEEDGH